MSLSHVLTNVSAALYSINPYLCKIPPRGFDDELCFCDNDADVDVGGYYGSLQSVTNDYSIGNNILCKDLDQEHALSVGSWLLEPQQLAVEGIVGIFICCIILVWLIPKLRKISTNHDEHDASMTTTKQKQQQQQQQQIIQHPTGVPFISLCCLSIMFYYKMSGFKNKMYFLVMPCNMQWILSVLQCYIIPDSYTFTQLCLLQLRITYLFSVVIAIVTPNTGDCTGFGEYEFYWFNHFVLLILPLLYIKANKNVSCYPQSKTTTTTTTSVLAYNTYWWLFSNLIFYIFYFGFVTIMSVYAGLNLNFMLHPPDDHFILKGKSFRLVATALLTFLYIFSRLLCLFVEKKYLTVTTTTNVTTTGSNKQTNEGGTKKYL